MYKLEPTSNVPSTITLLYALSDVVGFVRRSVFDVTLLLSVTVCKVTFERRPPSPI